MSTLNVKASEMMDMLQNCGSQQETAMAGLGCYSCERHAQLHNGFAAVAAREIQCVCVTASRSG